MYKTDGFLIQVLQKYKTFFPERFPSLSPPPLATVARHDTQFILTKHSSSTFYDHFIGMRA